MRITHKVDYGVRAMVVLGRAPEGGTLVKRETLATEASIPPAFLDDILRSLRAGSLVASQRGSAGGWRLARPAAKITVAEIIRALEGPLASVRGIRPHELPQNNAGEETMAALWVAVRESLRSVLEHVTVADLVANKLPKEAAALLKHKGAWEVH